MSAVVSLLCGEERHAHCDEVALDVTADEFVECECGCHTFPRLHAEADRADGIR